MLKEGDIICLVDEDDNEFEVEVISIIKEFDSRYAVVVSTEEEDEDCSSDEEEVMILEIIQEEGNEQETFAEVEDEDLLEQLFEIFEKQMDDDE